MLKNIQQIIGINMTFLNKVRLQLIGILDEMTVNPIIYAMGDNSYKLSVKTYNCLVELDIFTDDTDFTDNCGLSKRTVVTFEWHYACDKYSYERSTGKMYLCDSWEFNKSSITEDKSSEFYCKLTEPLLKLING